MRITYLFLLVILFGCGYRSDNETTKSTRPNEESYAKKRDSYLRESIISPGVLRIYSDILGRKNDTIRIFSPDGSVYGQIHNPKKDISFPEVFLSNKENVFSRAYYPDYHLLIFDAFPIENGRFRIYINDQEKIIHQLDGITYYESWESHIGNAFISSSLSNPLREANSIQSAEIELTADDYKYLSYEVIQIKGDWAEVKCLEVCEGCPKDGRKIHGWLKWKENNKLLVRIAYLC